MSHAPRTLHDDSHPSFAWVSRLVDLLVTLLLWGYFTVGFVVLFSPFYVFAAMLAPDRGRAFQRLNHLFYRGFFLLCRLTMPRQKWHIDPSVAAVRSAVVVCNHASYIDPLLLISLFARHTTIVKNRLFHIPIFGWMLTLSGYLPADSQGALAGPMVERLEQMPGLLAGGGNLFVFPEGTRSRNRALGVFNPGVFKIARLCRAPLAVVRIENTDRLFTPGRFLFNTCEANTIAVRLLALVTPAYDGAQFSIKDLMDQVRSLLDAPEPSGPLQDATTRFCAVPISALKLDEVR
jgi:1-acyl-sn-glycerol-3-phosphate acyltransferase